MTRNPHLSDLTEAELCARLDESYTVVGRLEYRRSEAVRAEFFAFFNELQRLRQFLAALARRGR